MIGRQGINQRIRLPGILLLLAAAWWAGPLAGAGPAQREIHPSITEVHGPLATDPEVSAWVAQARTNYYALAKELSQKPTDKSRAFFLRLAFGELGSSYVINASHRYETDLEFKREAAVLLDAPSEDAWDAGLLGLLRCKPDFHDRPLTPEIKKQRDNTWTMDQRLWERITRALKSEKPHTRYLAANVLAVDDNPAWATQKCHVIAQSMATILSCKRRSSYLIDNIFDLEVSDALDHLFDQAECLGRVRPVPAGYLARLLPEEPEMVREAFWLALDAAGDPQGRPQVHRILTNSPSVFVRWRAMWRVSRRPQPEDQAVLELMAARDEFETRANAKYFYLPGVDLNLMDKRPWPQIYPLRMMAEEELQRRAKRPPKP